MYAINNNARTGNKMSLPDLMNVISVFPGRSIFGEMVRVSQE